MKTKGLRSNQVAAVAVALCIGGISISVVSSQTHDQPPLRQVADIPLPAKAVRFEVVANLDGFPGVHGAWAVPELGKMYASATGEHKVAVVDMESLKTIAKAGPVRYPDGIAYAPGPKRVFVSDEHGDADAVIDATTNALLTAIPLDGGAGNTVYDSGSGNILVAVHEKNELVVIDPATAKIVGRYPLPGIESPHGVTLDVNARLAFVAGEENHKLGLIDLTNMQLLATYPVGKDPDVLAFDPGQKQLYLSAESGNVAVFREKGKTLVSMGSLFVPHAHTVSVDPDTHLVYFPLQNVDGHPLLRIMEPNSTN